ncbi:MAG: Ig-like domain-containing protein [Flavobacteriales bacterium]
MADFEYTPDQEIEINRRRAIELMCRPFSSHEAGLPEWIKNSAAAYIREETPAEDRVIVVAFRQRKGAKSASIACLDFVGMTSREIEGNFRVWADPDAAMRSARVQRSLGELGGHGNGGKCYMTQMFEDHAMLQTSRSSKACAYGVKGGTVDLGYVPDAKHGKDYRIDDVLAEVHERLTDLGVNLLRMPDVIRAVAEKAKGYTLIQGIGPKNCQPNIPVQSLVESLVAHPQMTRAIQLCKILVLVDGKPFGDGKPLHLPEIPQMEGANDPLVINIPPSLKDPVTEHAVTTKAGLDSRLEIRTSDKNMVLGRGGKRLWRHTVNYVAQGGSIGYMPMTDLVVASAYRDKMYCDCHLDSLEQFGQNDRGRLADNQLTRAVNAWIAEQVEVYCRKFEALERKKTSQKEKDEVSQMNEWLDKWKNQFLQEFMQGLFGDGEGGGGGRKDPSLPSGKPAKLELSLSHSKAGIGVFIKPTLKFYDASGQRIRPIPYQWVSEDTNVAMVDEDLMQVLTFSFGKTNIYAQCLDVKVSSNRATLEVVRLVDVRINPERIEMPAGTRQRFEAICKLGSGEETTDVYLTWIEGNSAVAKVSGSGLVFAFNPGTTEVTASDDHCKSDHPAMVVVTPGGAGDRGNNSGRGYPRILISEVNSAPGEDEPPQFPADVPAVWQRPDDVENDIWWINLASPFAWFFYDTKDFGPKSLAWRMYHIERYVDILVQIAMTVGPDSQEVRDSTDWMLRAASIEADIRERAIDGLREFIQSGTMN